MPGRGGSRGGWVSGALAGAEQPRRGAQLGPGGRREPRARRPHTAAPAAGARPRARGAPARRRRPTTRGPLTAAAWSRGCVSPRRRRPALGRRAGGRPRRRRSSKTRPRAPLRAARADSSGAHRGQPRYRSPQVWGVWSLLMLSLLKATSKASRASQTQRPAPLRTRKPRPTFQQELGVQGQLPWPHHAAVVARRRHAQHLRGRGRARSLEEAGACAGIHAAAALAAAPRPPAASRAARAAPSGTAGSRPRPSACSARLPAAAHGDCLPGLTGSRSRRTRAWRPSCVPTTIQRPGRMLGSVLGEGGVEWACF